MNSIEETCQKLKQTRLFSSTEINKYSECLKLFLKDILKMHEDGMKVDKKITLSCFNKYLDYQLTLEDPSTNESFDEFTKIVYEFLIMTDQSQPNKVKGMIKNFWSKISDFTNYSHIINTVNQKAKFSAKVKSE